MAGRYTLPRKEAAAGTNSQGGGATFPEGTYLVTLENVRQSELREWHTRVPMPRQNRDGETYQPRPQVVSPQADFVSIRFGQGQPLTEESDPPGNLKLFQELVLRDGEAAIGQDTEGLEHGWLLDRSQRVALNLANSFGAVQENGEGIYIADNFAEMLKGGALNNRQVIVDVSHRRYHTRDQKAAPNFDATKVEPEGISVEITRFASAEG